MTQREFAQMVHVSQATVSMALKDSPEISLKMRRHIQGLAEKLGYRPNLAGQLLRKGKNNLIGVILPSMEYSFYAELLEQLHVYALKKGYILLLERSGEEELFKHAIRTMNQYNVSGLIAAAGSGWIEKYANPDTPTVLISPGKKTALDRHHVMYVSPDLYKSGYELGKYLLSKGRRNLVYVGQGGDPRFSGLAAACSEMGGVVPEVLFSRENTAETGYAAGGMLLEKYPQCDAVVSHNDNTAIGVLRRFYEEKIAVPDRIAVVGFDNISSGAYTAPALTSAGTPFNVFAKAIIDGLLKMISTGEKAGEIKLEIVLNIRESA